MKVDRAGLRRVARILLVHDEEDSSYKDAFDDDENIRWIEEQLERGNSWAWTHVCVQATLHDLFGAAYLGGCSYESEAAFRQCAYYEQLVTDAVEDLAYAIENFVREHDIWVHDRVNCIPCAAKPLSETT